MARASSVLHRRALPIRQNAGHPSVRPERADNSGKQTGATTATTTTTLQGGRRQTATRLRPACFCRETARSCNEIGNPEANPAGASDLTVPSVRALITMPSAESDLLIIFASSSCCPDAPVLRTCRAAHPTPRTHTEQQGGVEPAQRGGGDISTHAMGRRAEDYEESEQGRCGGPSQSQRDRRGRASPS